MFWTIIICLGVAWVGQSYLSFRQSRAFANAFLQMRRKGSVAIGKFQGGVVQGAIVMLRIDRDGIVTEGIVLNGVTVFARFRDFPLYHGQHLASVDVEQSTREYGRSVGKAVRNAVNNYNTVTAGGTPVEPPTPLGRAIDNISRWRRKEVVA